jgi:hypothetical protein
MKIVYRPMPGKAATISQGFDSDGITKVRVGFHGGSGGFGEFGVDTAGVGFDGVED